VFVIDESLTHLRRDYEQLSIERESKAVSMILT